MYQEYLNRFPGRKAFIEALNYDGGTPISTGTSKICREVKVCGVIDIAVHLGSNGQIYVRALDFTVSGPSFSTDPVIIEAATARILGGKTTPATDVNKKLRESITNFINSVDKVDRNCKVSQKILDTYREEIGDPQGKITETMTRANSGASRRTNQKIHCY